MIEIDQLPVDDVEVISTTSHHKGFLNVSSYRLRHPLFAGGMSEALDREVLLRGNVGALLAYDPKRKEVVLIEQFRVGAYAAGEKPWLIELVAGIEEPDEALDILVKREAVEEAGIHIEGELVKICDYLVSPGGSDEKVSLYCGQVDSSHAGGLHGLAEEGEDIRVHVFSLDDAFEAVRDGLIENAATIIALQWLELNHERLFR